jgi:hypothetical protein
MSTKQTTTKNAGSASVQKTSQKTIQNAIARVHKHARAYTSHRHYDDKKKTYVVEIVDITDVVLERMSVGKRRSVAREIQKGIQNAITQARVKARSKKQNVKKTKNAGKQASGNGKKNAGGQTPAPHVRKQNASAFEKQKMDEYKNAKITHVEMWYDRHSRNWIVQRKDVNEYQIGDAAFAGTRKDALAAKKRFESDIGKIRDEIEN